MVERGRTIFTGTQAECEMIRETLGEDIAAMIEFRPSDRPSWWRKGRPDLTILPSAGNPRYRIPEIDAA